MKDYKEFNILAKETIMNELKGSIAEDLFDLSSLNVSFYDDGAYGINEYCMLQIDMNYKNDVAKEISKKLNHNESTYYNIRVDEYNNFVSFSLSIYDDVEYVDIGVVNDATEWFAKKLKEEIEKF